MCIYLADLDDTLFRTIDKHPDHRDLSRVTTARNGHHGHMDRAQRGLFAALRATGTVIPVTARSSEAFERVHIDFGTRQAVLANGAVIRDGAGQPDPAWSAHTARIGSRFAALFAEIIALVEAEFGPAARSWIVHEAAAPAYACVKMNARDGLAIKDGITAAQELLTMRLDLSDLWIHVNGNNLSVTPRGISKRDACLYLIERLDDRDESPLIGLGDSLTDLSFLRLCDFMIIPTRSQIMGALNAAEVRT